MAFDYTKKGLPTGGTTGQVLAKASGTSYDTEWVDQSGGGGTPGGSDTQVQFNDGGAFGGDPALVWDKARDSLNIQTTLKQHALHVAGSTGTTIADVTTASISLVEETLNASPTGTVAGIAEFAAPSSGFASQNTSGSGFIANGQSFDYRVSAVIYSAAINSYYKSAQFTDYSFTDSINDGTTAFSMVVDPGGTQADQTHWHIQRQIDGAGFSDSFLRAVGSNFEDGGGSGADSVNNWPTTYRLVYTVPSASSGISIGQTNVGSGAFTANGTTYIVQIREAASFGGLYYCEQAGTSASWMDPNDSSTFDLDSAWAPGTGDEQIIRISNDGGASWTHMFVGGGSAGSFVWFGQGNDTDAEAAWSRDISTVNLTFGFRAYARNTSPSGAAVFTQSATTYEFNITTPNVSYIFKHTLSGFNAPGARVLADYSSSVTNGLDVNTSVFIDPSYPSWASGTSLSPSTYGFNGASQNRQYKLYAYSGSLLIYSATALTVSTTAAGGSKYVSGTFSYPSGITTVKITRSIDGGAFNAAKIFSSPAAVFTDDATDNTWNQSPTVTPSESVPTASRFDLDRTSFSQVSDNISVIETSGTGNRFPSISFGLAPNKNTGATSTIARISSFSAAGSLMLGAGTTEGYTNASMGTMSWRLGATTEFNIQRSTSNHPTFWAADATNPLAYLYSVGDSNRGTLIVGQSSIAPTVTSSKFVVAPTAGGTIAVHIRRTSGATGAAILIDENGIFRGEWNSDGRVAFGVTGVVANVQVNIGATTGRAQIRFNDGGGAASPTAGDLWRSGGQMLFRNASSQTVTLCPVLTATATLNFPSIAANSTAQLTMTVTGATVGDAVFVGLPSAIDAGLVATGFVSATNTVAIRLHNTSGGAVDPASATFRAVVARL